MILNTTEWEALKNLNLFENKFYLWPISLITHGKMLKRHLCHNGTRRSTLDGGKMKREQHEFYGFDFSSLDKFLKKGRVLRREIEYANRSKRMRMKLCASALGLFF